MLRLPAPLQRRLESLFPRARDRDHFIAEAVSRALDAAMAKAKASVQSTQVTSEPCAVGGTLHLFTDGGSRGNPGQAAVGCVLIDPLTRTVLREHGACIGVQTNNIAEYRALIEGLKIAEPFHPHHLVCHLDSELVVKQLTGEYRVKMATFQPLIEEIHAWKARFPSVQFVHVPRSQNAHADVLVNRALDAC